jgi:tetrahydromethanopterin S-methyltransferase subunit F
MKSTLSYNQTRRQMARELEMKSAKLRQRLAKIATGMVIAIVVLTILIALLGL